MTPPVTEQILSKDEILALFKSVPQEDYNQAGWVRLQRIAIGRAFERALVQRIGECPVVLGKPDFWIYQSISAPWEIYASDVRQTEPVLGYREIPVRATLAKEPPEAPLQDVAVRHSSPAREIAMSLVAGILARAPHEEGVQPVPEKAGASLISEIVDRIWDLSLAERQFLNVGCEKQRARDADAAGVLMGISPQADRVFADFLEDLARSRKKYPGNARMFDALAGEVCELGRAYAGDGDQRAEALDVAVCAFRIAAEGDAGGNVLLDGKTPQETLAAACGELAKECARLQFKLGQTAAALEDIPQNKEKI